MTRTNLSEDENPVTLNFLWRQSKDCHGKGKLGKMLHYLGTPTLILRFHPSIAHSLNFSQSSHSGASYTLFLLPSSSRKSSTFCRVQITPRRLSLESQSKSSCCAISTQRSVPHHPKHVSHLA